MRNRITAMAAFSALVLGGCSLNQTAPLTANAAMCNFVKHDLAVSIPQSGGAADAGGVLSPFAQVIEQSLQVHDNGVGQTEEAQVLFLSGGSEHGAYGAGILNGWGGDGDIPDLQVVTGVSTGSILASFAFVGKGDFAADGYTISNEDQLLTVYSKPKDGKPDAANFLDLLKKGAFADLDPLRTRLAGFLTQDYSVTGPSGPVSTTVMAEVTKRHTLGRRLYAGAVDADTGLGTAFDLGDMASRYVSNHEGRQAQWLDCYISAIIASSATPMAAPPEFIDNTMYIDGGVRFGLFGDSVIEVLKARRSLTASEGSAPRPPRVYAVIDGTLELPDADCPKKDAADCSGTSPSWSNSGQHKGWNVLQLALRSERLLVNQVYRFSAKSVEADACEGAGCFNFLRIDPDVANFTITLPAPLNAGNSGALTCAQWKAIDITQDNPIQFHKRYMRCLIKYGESKVSEAGWGA